MDEIDKLVKDRLEEKTISEIRGGPIYKPVEQYFDSIGISESRQMDLYNGILDLHEGLAPLDSANLVAIQSVGLLDFINKVYELEDLRKINL